LKNQSLRKSDFWLELSPEQKKSSLNGERQIIKGNKKSHEEVMRKLRNPKK
jgi:hypothetical protein